ncbi:e6e49165-40c0-4abb-8b6a-245dd0813068 [Sclerotinia trifoliorum]|uniref:E6e49165-40c0-4abb-8b6a-245dd0813068 n=1 Tax=Sclerotinia trifoliorum TaxID=28548 RepID=A0A8H2VW98_9HELO|nr:e6e49165-40c0-4abb-8b6a-245dd0813068 [Sclerotinia trifoliorum]
MESFNNEYKFKNMAYNTFQTNDFQGDHDDDSVLLAETYRPCKTLYISTTTDTHTLLNLSPSSRISFVKATFISSLFNRKIIPRRDYECAFSYADRELEGDETLEDCQIGDEATVNAVVWTGRDDEQKTEKSKRVRSALDLSDPDEDMEQSNLLPQLAPVAKKRKVRFADEMDIVSPPPTPSHSPSTSKVPGPQEYSMSGALGQGSRTIHFDDTLVRNATKDAFPQTGSLKELPPPKSLKSALKSPPPFDIYTGQESFIVPGYDSLGDLIAQRESSRRELRRNNDLSSDSSQVIPRKMEYGLSPTVYGTPCIFDLRALNQYLDPHPQRRFLDSHQSLFSPPAEQTPSIRSNSPHTSQTLFPSTQRTPSLSPASSFTPQTSFPLTQQKPLFKDTALSHAPSTSGVFSLSDLLIKKYFPSTPPIAASESILRPSSTLPPPPPSSHFSTQTIPSSLLQSLNPYFSAPSPPSPFLPSSRSPSTLQSLNPYFTNTSPPPPKYPPSQPIHPHNYNSPQLTKQSPMTSDYFQTARRKATPSESKCHPLPSPLPPLPPPHVRIEPPSPTHSPYAHRPPPPDFSDRLQAESPSNISLDDNPQSVAPTRQPPPPPPPLRRSPRLHTPSPSPPSSPAHKPYKLSYIPPFYKYNTLPPSQPPSTPPQSSLPTPEPTPPIPSSGPKIPPPIKPAKVSSNSSSKPIYYSPLHPLPKDFALKGAVFIPSLAHEILPEDFLACTTVKQLIKLQGWEMSEREWLAVREVLESCKKGEEGARGNLEVLVKGMVETEELWEI